MKLFIFARKILLFQLLILSIITVKAENVKFYNINSLFGISMRETTSVCKDKNGFIWAASKTGIIRLTDDDYRIYQLPYETANIINVKLVYKNSVLLAYTNNGQLFYYNTLYDRFDLLINLSKALDNNFLSINSILIDKSNCFWIASSFGFFKYQNEKLTMIGTDATIVNKIEWFDDSHLIVARQNGLWLMDTQSNESKNLYENKLILPFGVSELFYDKATRKLWLGTMSKGLFCYDFNTKIFSNLLVNSLPKQPILAIETNSESSLLIGIDGQGIWELSRNGDRILNVYKENSDDPSSLRGNGVYDILCDNNQRVWVCSYSGGVSFFDQASPLVTQIVHQTNNSNSLVNNDVNNILEDRRGNIWFATNNGISCWEKVKNQWRNYYYNKQEQAQVFLTLCEDDNGRIWAGTYSSGVYIIDGETGKELAHYSQKEKGSPLTNDFVFDIIKDSQGDIWIGGVNSEIICYLTKENIFRNYSNQPLNAFAELSPNQLLLGCTYGLVLLNKQTGEGRTILGGCLVHDILVENGEVWISTSGDGLIRFNPKSGETEKFTTQSGLPSNFINSILSNDGYLWLGTENGLCRFNPKDKSVLTYSSILSLSRVSFNRNSQFKLKNGQLVWGTNDGAVLFDPKAIQQMLPVGRIFFQDLSILGRSIRDNSKLKINTPLDSLKKITLKYNQNTMMLELLPIGVVAGSRFSWKMEGLDKDWSLPSNHRILSYTNIPSGKFLLKIRLYDNSLSHIISERTIALKIIPPFWKTWWFLVLMFILISGIIYLYLWYYINQIKQHHNEEKVRFFANTAHDMRTSLTLIKAPIEELSKESNLSDLGRNYLLLATEQVRRLSSVVTQLMDFQKVDVGKGQLSLIMADIVKLIGHRRLMFESFAKSKNIELIFNSDQPTYITAVDESMIEKVVDNLISNAVKYSHPDTQIHLSLQCNTNNWILEVKDQGIGISRKAQHQLFKEFYRGENAINSKIVGSGIGLLLVKSYVNLHGGEINYISQENIGSIFTIIIPYKEVSYDIISNESADVKIIQQYQENNNAVVLPTQSNQNEMSILIVEDNDDLRNFMQNALQLEFNIFTAEDGVNAWEIIEKQMPDIVVSDVMMPNMDGFELCHLMKSTFETSHIPIILLTALSEKAEQLHGLGLGADDYLTKPFDMTLLTQRIKSIIRNREAVRERAFKLLKGKIIEPILANELNDKFVKKALEVTEANISNPEFGKDEFASAMNVSSSLLYKKIKSLTDQSPVDFIKIIRLNHALQLLKSKRYSVTEVSELCGFTTVGYFSTVFKKHFGKSPTDITE